MKVRWKVVFGLLISAAFLVYALGRVDFVEMTRAFSKANYIWTIPMMLAVILTMIIRAARWHWLIKPIQLVPFGSLFSSVMIGFMSNNLLPARLGEVVRAVSLSYKHSLSKSSVFATVVAERVFDSLGLLIVFFVTLIIVDIPQELQKASILALIATVLLLIFLYLLKFQTGLAVSLICVPLSKLSKKYSDKLEAIMNKFAMGLRFLTEPVPMIVILLYSVFLWSLTAISGYLIFIAFDLYPTVWAAFIVLFVTVLAVSLPSSPGYIGTYHAACILAFELVGSLGMFGHEVSNSVALSFSVVLWSCQFFPVTLLGLYYLKKEHLKISDMSKEKVINESGQ